MAGEACAAGTALFIGFGAKPDFNDTEDHDDANEDCDENECHYDEDRSASRQIDRIGRTFKQLYLIH